MAEKKGFVIYFDWREQFELLPPEDRGKLLMALLDYGESGKCQTYTTLSAWPFPL